MSELIEKMNQQFTEACRLAESFRAMAEQALNERDAARERVIRLEGALRGLLEVCHCDNGCAPDDMTCATNVARNALEGKK